MVYFAVCLLDGRIRIEVYNLALGGRVKQRREVVLRKDNSPSGWYYWLP